MTPEQIERNRAFIRDLRANPRKAKNTMRDDGGGRCCLCVAYDTAQTLGAALPTSYLNDKDCPPKEIARFYGWPDPNPEIFYDGQQRCAAVFNDGTTINELTHAQIADAFEETFPEIKP